MKLNEAPGYVPIPILHVSTSRRSHIYCTFEVTPTQE